jgi:hypothetical protein
LITYSESIENLMKNLYASLSEKDRRRYAAIEAIKLGHGGKLYICELFGCHHETLDKGIVELDKKGKLESPRIRQEGGGRKKNP